MARRSLQVAASLGLLPVFALFLVLRAESPAPAKPSPDKAPAAPKSSPAKASAGTNAAPVAPKPSPDKAAGTNTAPVTTKPPEPPPDFNRYGKIWTASEDAAHPLKLNLPTGVGEMKIPSPDELKMRDKLEQLATLSDEEIRQKLEEWAPYGKMKIGDQGQMLVHIQQFKDQRSRIAMEKARDLGLNLNPDQRAKFEQQYWDKRLQMERNLLKQVGPLINAGNQKMREELFREFSSAGPVVPVQPAPKKPESAPAPKDKPVAVTTTNAPPAKPQPTKAAEAKPAPAAKDKEKDSPMMMQ